MHPDSGKIGWRIAIGEEGGASLCPKLRIFVMRVKVCRVNVDSMDHNALGGRGTHLLIYVWDLIRCGAMAWAHGSLVAYCLMDFNG